MNVNNAKLRSMMESGPEVLSDEDMELFVYEFANANLIILCDSEDDDAEERKYVHFDDLDEFDIIKLEDDEGHEFIPLFTDDDAVDNLDISGLCVVIATVDLVNLLHDNEENNDKLEGLILNPFSENAAEIDYYSLLELFGLEECGDPNCGHEHHHHH